MCVCVCNVLCVCVCNVLCVCVRSYMEIPANSWVDDFIDWLNPGGGCCRIYTRGPNIGKFCPANESEYANPHPVLWVDGFTAGLKPMHAHACRWQSIYSAVDFAVRSHRHITVCVFVCVCVCVCVCHLQRLRLCA